MKFIVDMGLLIDVTIDILLHLGSCAHGSGYTGQMKIMEMIPGPNQISNMPPLCTEIGLWGLFSTSHPAGIGLWEAHAATTLPVLQTCLI